MIEQLCYYATAIAWGIFILRFLLSQVFGVDFDFDFGLDIGDFISLKGLTHFVIGSGTYLSIKFYYHTFTGIMDYAIALCLGVVCMTLLYFIYKLMFKLETKPRVLTHHELIGKSARINSIVKTDKPYEYLIDSTNGIGSVELKAQSDTLYKVGEEVTILQFTNNFYLI